MNPTGTTDHEVLYRPRFFQVEELVSPTVFNTLGERAWLVMDYRILRTVDAVREFFGRPVTINNWHLGGNRTCSGFREPTCTVGAKFSQHRFGRAVDLLVRDLSADHVRGEILKNLPHFMYVTAMEDGVSWVHLDCRATAGSDIFLFKA
jgi:hypothetical protein